MPRRDPSIASELDQFMAGLDLPSWKGALTSPPTCVGSHVDLERFAPPSMRQDLRTFRKRVGIADCLGIIARPVPEMSVTYWAFHDAPIVLTKRERRLLTQVALHIETGWRLRKQPDALVAELRGGNAVFHRLTGAREPWGATATWRADVLEARAKRVSAARSLQGRRSDDALDLWPALVAGELTLAPRASRGYAVLEDPLPSRPMRALSRAERDVLLLAGRGLSNKMVAYTLGIGPSATSHHLANAAAKIGLASRVELLRVAAMLTQDPRCNSSDHDLTRAERDVLSLLLQGLSNPQIAKLRSRSVRTIANQVASLLRKTGHATRRGVIAGERLED